MKRTISLALLGLIAFMRCAEAEDPIWSFPDPAEYGAHLTELCKPEAGSALFIAALRDKGLIKAQAAEHLPQGTPERLRLTRVVRENLDDLYAYPNVASISYYVYRGASCPREKAEGKPAIAFASIATGVLSCQEKIGIENRPALAACIRELMK